MDECSHQARSISGKKIADIKPTKKKKKAAGKVQS